MTDFLYFRNVVSKMKGGELLFTILRVRHWLTYELSRLDPKTEADFNVLSHLNIDQIYWNEAWWRTLRERSRCALFPKIRKYL